MNPKMRPCIDQCMRAVEQYMSVLLFIMLFEVVLTFESVDEIGYIL